VPARLGWTRAPLRSLSAVFDGPLGGSDRAEVVVTAVVMARLSVMVVGLLLAGPMLLFCLRPDVVRAWFEGGEDALDRASSPANRGLIAELKRLGFEVLGVKAEKTPLRAAVRELSFVSRDRRCYASVAKSSVARLYYYTPFVEGGFVLTSNGAFPKIDSAVVGQSSHPGCEPERLLERHYARLDSLGRWGAVTPTAEARVEATYHYYRTPEVRRILRRTGAVLFLGLAIMAWVFLR
jgi:hypothetical protein